MFLYVLEMALAITLGLFIFTQVIIPWYFTEQYFPLFRRSKIAKVRRQVNEEIEQSAQWQEILDRIGNEYQTNANEEEGQKNA